MFEKIVEIYTNSVLDSNIAIIYKQKPMFKDEESFEESVKTGVKYGFQGKLCIHPNQVPLQRFLVVPYSS